MVQFMTATATGGATGGDWMTIIIMYAVIIGAMYFFMFRPQKKQQKQLAAMLAQLEVGDVVLTTSGFYGTIIDISDDTVIVEFGNNKNCRIPMQKTAIVDSERPGADTGSSADASK